MYTVIIIHIIHTLHTLHTLLIVHTLRVLKVLGILRVLKVQEVLEVLRGLRVFKVSTVLKVCNDLLSMKYALRTNMFANKYVCEQTGANKHVGEQTRANKLGRTNNIYGVSMICGDNCSLGFKKRFAVQRNRKPQAIYSYATRMTQIFNICGLLDNPIGC